MQFLRVAAAVLVFVAGGYLVFSLTLKEEKEARLLTLSDISEELASQENLFQLTIDQKLNEIQAYQVNQDDYESTQTVDLDDGECRLLIWRTPDHSMHIDRLNEQEWFFLQASAQKHSLQKITEQNPDLDIQQVLPTCIQNGWVTDFEISDEA